ncbi:MAG: DUF1552 domain-containing protein [Deltaproteobacteria bacterium]|nr:DUF1552 domain-containing protein [Deltaproteobacteria bacterium]
MSFKGYVPVRKGSSISRRSLLRGAGGVSLALPFLEAMEGKAFAAPPQRFILVYHSQGMFMDEWQPKLKAGGAPTKTEYAADEYDMNSLSADLAPYKDDLLFLTGLDNKITPGGNAHEVVFNYLLTGKKATGQGFFQAGGPSIDQVISTKIYGSATPRSRILHLGPNSSWHVCYSAKNSPVSRESNPTELVKNLFMGVSTGGPSMPDPLVEKERMRNKRMLDAVKESGDALRAKLGGDDKKRVEAYLTDLSELSNGLSAPVLASASCGKPTVNGNSAYDPRSSDLSSVAAMALACDLTRVITLDFGGPDGNMRNYMKRPDGKALPGDGTDWHQDVVHRAWQRPGEFGGTVENIAEAKMNFRAAAKYMQGTFANLIGKIKSVREADGSSLLDHTAILYVNEFGEETHGFKNYPFMIAGKAGGALRPGRWLRHNGTSHQRLLLSMLATYMPTTDPTFTSFGEPEWNVGGPLANLG